MRKGGYRKEFQFKRLEWRNHADFMAHHTDMKKELGTR